jgi:hypothetical protein
LSNTSLFSGTRIHPRPGISHFSKETGFALKEFVI